jgi:DNA ligase 1
MPSALTLMKRFLALYTALDATTRTNDKVDALVEYFAAADPADAAWAAYLLAGKKLGKSLSSRRLRQWAAEVTAMDAWLIEECYQAVGDLSETLALLLPEPEVQADPPLHQLIEQYLLPLAGEDEAGQRQIVVELWRTLDASSRYLVHKLLSGNFRVGVSRQLLVRAMARIASIDEGVMAHRMSARWKPTTRDYLDLISSDAESAVDVSRPYPFLLAHPLQADLATLGEPAGWQLEWKWDGIRAQMIRRSGQTFIVSRGEEHVATAFPEIMQLGTLLPDGTVLDGEILAWAVDRPMPFAALQRRLNRKNVELMLFTDVPVVFMAYDLMELAGEDIRTRPLVERRMLLEALVDRVGDLRLSPLVQTGGWMELEAAMAEARARGVEGLMIKRRDSAYEVGRPRGVWWKLKVEPYTVDAVLIAAQPGHGKRAGLFTDYTFAVRDGEALVPIAKAYSGLTDIEIDEVDRWVRAHITGRYGPVRSVEPALVFELGFEGIQASDRHKSGIALRFPRMLRQRTDKPVSEIDTLQSLQALLAQATRL